MNYIDDRVSARLSWYDRRAQQCKRAFFACEYSAGILSILVVLLIDQESVPRWAVATIAAIVAVIASAERTGQFGSRWTLYRLAAEALDSERYLMVNDAGPYRGEADKNRLFVERCEALLAGEAARWRAVIHNAGPTPGDSPIRRS